MKFEWTGQEFRSAGTVSPSSCYSSPSHKKILLFTSTAPHTGAKRRLSFVLLYFCLKSVTLGRTRLVCLPWRPRYLDGGPSVSEEGPLHLAD